MDCRGTCHRRKVIYSYLDPGVVKDIRQYRILVADDIPENVDLLEAYLFSLGHEIVTARNGREALEVAVEQHPDLILLDIMMPEMTGIQVCEQLRERGEFQFTPIVMVTSLSEVADKVAAIEAGATDFLTKPVNKLELVTRVNSLLRFKSLQDDLTNSYDIIISLAMAIEAKDPYTKGHSERVANVSSGFARFLGLKSRDVDNIHKAGYLHDIGKIGISDNILNKPGKLTEEEYDTIIDHPVIGEYIVRNLKFLKDVLPYIRHHHERYDGGGHPDKLVGDAIPLGARIISIVDTFDAIISTRSYREARSLDEAIAIFESEKFLGQWDPELIEKFIGYLRESYEDNNGEMAFSGVLESLK